MRTAVRSIVTALAAACVMAVLLVAARPASGQAQPAAYRAPRTADGKPDLNGIWQALNEANYDIQMHMAKPAMALLQIRTVHCPHFNYAARAVGSVRPGVGVVEGNDIPYLPAALAKKKANQENWVTSDPEIKCYLPGVPRATYMPYPFQIFQSSKAIFIAYEYAGAVRNVYLKDPGPAPIDSWMNRRVAKWEAETLVIDVTGFNDQSWFDRAGNFHSEKLHVVERYTRTGPDVITYEATIEDPKVFSRPWKMSMPLYRRLEKNAQLMDFKCVEFVEELICGARSGSKPLTK